MKILIIRISSLGDVVLTEPVIKELKENYPESEIHFLSRSPFNQLLNLFRKKIIFHDWREKKKCIANLRKIEFDLVIDLHKKLNTFFIKRRLRAKKIISYNKNYFHRLMLVKKLTKTPIDSTLFSYLSTLNKIGIKTKKISPKLEIDEKQNLKTQIKMQDFGVDFNKTIVAVFPGATHPTKCYPLELWVRFMDMIVKSWNIQFVLMGGIDEKNFCASIKRKTKSDVVDFCNATSVSELCSAISLSDIVLSNDSGPMHIAAAYSKPQIAIFGATHTNLGFRPLNNKAVVLQSDIRCRPCSLHGGKICKKNHFLCMYKIYPGTIFQEFKKLFEDFIVD